MIEAEMTRILLVEDDDSIRETLELALRSEGYFVQSACNGREALEWLEADEKPTLILLDQMMPYMSGTEFLAKLRQDPVLGKIPVVLVSASLDFPADAPLIKKPFSIEELFACISRFAA